MNDANADFLSPEDEGNLKVNKNAFHQREPDENERNMKILSVFNDLLLNFFLSYFTSVFFSSSYQFKVLIYNSSHCVIT